MSKRFAVGLLSLLLLLLFVDAGGYNRNEREGN